MDAMFSLLLSLITILSLFAGRGSAEKAQALFVFGDSFADTGNRNPYNQSENETWRRPYGFTWPGYPAGRFSSGKIQPDFWGCGPQIGKTSCDSKYDDFLALHTRVLREGVESLRSDLKELSIIIPDLVSAFNHIFSRPAQFGFVDLFVPCCAEKGGVERCGEVDERGRALFEVCSNTDEKFYWDAYHPTERGWNAIMWLYSNGAAAAAGENKTISFIEGAASIIEWVESLGFVDRCFL